MFDWRDDDFPVELVIRVCGQYRVEETNMQETTGHRIIIYKRIYAYAKN